MQRTYGHGQLLGERSGPAVADPDLVPVRAQVLPAAGAALAGAAAEHGVAGHPAAEPGRIDPRAGRGDDAAPLVADADRVDGLVAVQVGHRAGEELRVRAADPGPLDVHDDLARTRFGRCHVLDLGRGRTGDDEGAHAHPASRMVLGSGSRAWALSRTRPAPTSRSFRRTGDQV